MVCSGVGCVVLLLLSPRNRGAPRQKAVPERFSQAEGGCKNGKIWDIVSLFWGEGYNLKKTKTIKITKNHFFIVNILKCDETHHTHTG